MKKSNLILAILAGVLIACLVSFVSTRNEFVSMQESVDASWSQVENQLQRRSDLIPNLVSAVKGYAKHEASVFDDIAQARAKLAGARSPSEKVAAGNQFESSLSRLLVVVEQYPNLKADQHFTALMDELAGSENRISVERKRYNESVQLYNTKLRQFPGVVVASMLHYEKRDFFKVEEKAKAVPKVEF